MSLCRGRRGAERASQPCGLRVAPRQASPPTPSLCPPRKLIGISFGDLNPFPLRQIRNRRAYHLEKVRLELTELEAIRQDFLRERDASPDKGALVSDEEDT